MAWFVTTFITQKQKKITLCRQLVYLYFLVYQTAKHGKLLWRLKIFPSLLTEMKYIYLLRGCQQVEHEEYNDTHLNKTQTDTNQGNRILTSPSLISISVSSLNNTIISVSVFYCLCFPTKPQFIFVCRINKVLSLNSLQ